MSTKPLEKSDEKWEQHKSTTIGSVLIYCVRGGDDGFRSVTLNGSIVKAEDIKQLSALLLSLIQ